MKREKDFPKENEEIYFNINQIAKLLDVVPATIRNWEKAGLFTAKRSGNNYRIYTFNDIEYLKKIKRYSIDENMNMSLIKKILSNNSELCIRPIEKVYSKSIDHSKLKTYREKNGYTLDEVAKLMNISPAYLSKIEHGNANVSLDLLEQITKLYGESILSFFDFETEEQNPVFKKNEGQPMKTILQGVDVKLLNNSSDAFLSTLFTVAPTCGDFNTHCHRSGKEFIFVLNGKLEVTLDKKHNYILHEQDSIHFDSKRMHSWHNCGNTLLKMLWIHTDL